MIVDPAIEKWLLSQERESDPVELAMRQVGEDRGFPIVGPLVGRALDVLVHTSQSRRIFEMGSGFGYSTWWHARAAGDAGRVMHTDGSKELSGEARRWMTQAGLSERVDFEVGNALEILDNSAEVWDYIFIDVDKEQYPDAWNIARDRIRVGGLIVTDNTLWSGKVADRSETDMATRGVRQYVQQAMQDPSFSTTILPIRDGVAVSVKVD